MGDETSASEVASSTTPVEHCPQCTTGVLFTTADASDHRHVHCFACGYHASEVKAGYEVKAPGEPITPVESTDTGEEG